MEQQPTFTNAHTGTSARRDTVADHYTSPTLSRKASLPRQMRIPSAENVWTTDHIVIRPSPPDHADIWKPLEVQLTEQQTLDRMAKYMQINSIECTFEAAAKGRIDCTADRDSCVCLEFSIYLWTSADNKHVAVGIQRRRGCCIGLQKIRKGLFGALMAEQELSQRQLIVANTIPDWVNERVKTYSTSRENSFECVRENISSICQLLKSKQKDQNLLGLENLYYLTKPVRERSCAMTATACVLLCEEEPFIFLRERLSECLMSTTDSSSNVQAETSQTDRLEQSRLALKIVINCLLAVTKLRDTETIKLDSSSAFWRGITSVAVANLHHANGSPQNAAMSARCLYLIHNLTSSSSCLAADNQVDLPDLIEAHSYGKAHHYDLEQETEKLMVLLGSTGERSSHVAEVTTVTL